MTLPLALILSIGITHYLGIGQMDVPFHRANTSVSIDQSDTLPLVDRFIDEDRDEFGVNASKPRLSYENLSDPSVDTLHIGSSPPLSSYDLQRERKVHEQILQEQDALLYPNPKRVSRGISEEELIVKNERLAGGDYSYSPKSSIPVKEERPHFNTILMKSRYSDDSDDVKASFDLVVKAKIYSPHDQRLVHGSKAVFKLKEAVGNLTKGDYVYGRVTYSNHAFDFEFKGAQFGLKQNLFLFSDHEKGIYALSEEEEFRNEVQKEGRLQAGQIAGDIVRSIPILGNAGSRILYRMGQGGGQKVPEIELLGGEVFSLENDQ